MKTSLSLLTALMLTSALPASAQTTSPYTLERGYPTPSIHRDRALEAVLPALEARGVYSRGRFGAWKYEVSNQDHSFAQGVECIDHLRTGSLETTLRQPDVVNARRSTPRAAVAR